ASRASWTRRKAAVSTTAVRYAWRSAVPRSRRLSISPGIGSRATFTRRTAVPEPLLELRGVEKHFPVKTGRFRTTPLKAVDGIDLALTPGDSVALVGESGSGKSTVARLIAGLHRPAAGEILFEGRPIHG